MGCPVHNKIPGFLSHLQVYHGMPVPFVQLVANGVPDFRVTDREKMMQCLIGKLCGICGRSLGQIVWFTGGPACVENRLFHDPAMHEDCARYAKAICPFLNGSRKNYSDMEQRPANVPDDTVLSNDELSSDEPTEKQYLLKCYLKDVRPVQYKGHILSQAMKPWMAVEEYDR